MTQLLTNRSCFCLQQMRFVWDFSIKYFIVQCLKRHTTSRYFIRCGKGFVASHFSRPIMNAFENEFPFGVLSITHSTFVPKNCSRMFSSCLLPFCAIVIEIDSFSRLCSSFRGLWQSKSLLCHWISVKNTTPIDLSFFLTNFITFFSL